MYLKEGQKKIFFVNLVYLLIALLVFTSRRNYEFIGYVGVIVLFLVLILTTNKRVNYPNSVLWGLTLWGVLHMLGGAVLLDNGAVLYTKILIPLSDSIFRYDQLVHLIGFFVATLLMWVLLKPNLGKKVGWASLGIVVVMAGLGVGALNEIIEFGATVIVPDTNVGGYWNTSLDLVSDLIGALGALWYIRRKRGEI